MSGANFWGLGSCRKAMPEAQTERGAKGSAGNMVVSVQIGGGVRHFPTRRGVDLPRTKVLGKTTAVGVRRLRLLQPSTSLLICCSTCQPTAHHEPWRAALSIARPIFRSPTCYPRVS